MPKREMYKLVPCGSLRFRSAQGARIEALRALAVWQAREHGRRFTILECKEDFVISRLTWQNADTAAGADLSASCSTRGVREQQIDSMVPPPSSPWNAARTKQDEA